MKMNAEVDLSAGNMIELGNILSVVVDFFHMSKDLRYL